MVSDRLESVFPCLSTSKKVSFAIHAGAREALAHDGVPDSPVTPIFQSEFFHGILGAQQAVIEDCSSLPSNGVAPDPLWDLKQSALVYPEQSPAHSNLCCDSLNLAKSGNLRSVPAELIAAGGLNVRAVEYESGAVNVGCSLRPEAPADVPGLLKDFADSALPPLVSGVHGVEATPSVEQNGESKNGAFPSSVDRSELCGESSNGRSWSSVVTNNSFGGFDCLVADILGCKLLQFIMKHPSLLGWPMTSLKNVFH